MLHSFLWVIPPAYEFYMPTFRNTLSVPSSYKFTFVKLKTAPKLKTTRYILKQLRGPSVSKCISFHKYPYLISVDATSVLAELSRYSSRLQLALHASRNPVKKRILAPVKVGPGPHPASCTIGFGSLSGLKRPARGV